MFRVEEIQEADLKAVLRLAWKALPAPLPAPLLMEIARRDPDHFRVVRETETDQIRGFIVAAKLPIADERLLLLAVDPEFRHQGLRRALLRQLQETLGEQGERTFTIDVPRMDDDSMAFFQREGYAVVGVEGQRATLAKALTDAVGAAPPALTPRPTTSPKR